MIASNPTIGFDTGVENAVEAIRKLKTTVPSNTNVGGKYLPRGKKIYEKASIAG